MPTERLDRLRAELSRQNVAGFIVPRADEHLGEYVPANAERLAWLTGFTGSAGLAVVLPTIAAAFTDGRYVLQLAAQTPAPWQRLHITETPPPAWIAEHAPGARIGYDPMLIGEDALQRFTAAGLDMVPLAQNPIDAIWTDRPQPPLDPAIPHQLANAGLSSSEKREEIAVALKAAHEQAAVITDPASIAWLLNIRGSDVPFTPFALGFALINADASCDLFMDPRKLPPELHEWLGNTVSVQDRSALPKALANFRGKKVRVDPAASPVWFAQTLRANGAEVTQGMDPCILPKACKNPTERQGIRTAHARDAIAICRFLQWLDKAMSAHTPTTEISAAAQLLEFRAADKNFRGESFPAISGAGEHGAIIHYRVSPETNRPLNPEETYLIDSGAQYTDGTTDITRTIWTGGAPPPAELRDRVTRVLKGHIAIATLKFPQGVAGPHIDAFARAALWQAGLDYDHGTGHGVGSYLSVHEGPVSLSRAAKPIPIAEGMLLSNEPGFYLPGHYGIRLENLLLVRPAAPSLSGKPFLEFETVTLAPFDRRLIDSALLTDAEVQWLNNYHARVLAEVGPHLGDEERKWLEKACK